MKALITPLIVGAVIISGPAFAGKTQPVIEEPTPTPAAAPPAPETPNWTGVYLGAQLGWADVDTDASALSGNGLIGGIIAGYDVDLGDWVVGVGFDYDFADIGLGGGIDLESVWRAKLRGGYKFGSGLAYGTFGYAKADTNDIGSEDGYFIGAGYEHLLTDSFSLGGEVLYHDFGNFNNTGIEVDATTVQVRGTLRF